MSWLDVATLLFDTVRAVTSLAANWLIQSTLLIGCGLAVGYALHRSGSAVQSAVYRTTLAAVLTCPLATWCLSLLGISGWSLEMPRAYSVESVAVVAKVDVAAPERPATVHVEGVVEPTAVFGVESFGKDETDGSSRTSIALPQFDDDIRRTGPQSESVRESLPLIKAPVPARSFNLHRFGITAAIGGVVWLAGSA